MSTSISSIPLRRWSIILKRLGRSSRRSGTPVLRGGLAGYFMSCISLISRVRSIGVSNFNLKQLQTIVKVANIKPAVNQVRFYPVISFNSFILARFTSIPIIIQNINHYSNIVRSTASSLKLMAASRMLFVRASGNYSHLFKAYHEISWRSYRCSP